MHILGFSHHYTKLHGQTWGTLIYSVPNVLLDSLSDNYTIKYDTEYEGGEAHYNLIPGYYTMLVFLGNKNIPFTTYRIASHNPMLIGKKFAFKFKGEPLPEDLPLDIKNDLSLPAVRIFESVDYVFLNGKGKPPVSDGNKMDLGDLTKETEVAEIASQIITKCTLGPASIPRRTNLF